MTDRCLDIILRPFCRLGASFSLSLVSRTLALLVALTLNSKTHNFNYVNKTVRIVGALRMLNT